jgi:hypothetical protein
MLKPPASLFNGFSFFNGTEYVEFDCLLNVPVTDEKFQFTPPDGAEKVDSVAELHVDKRWGNAKFDPQRIRAPDDDDRIANELAERIRKFMEEGHIKGFHVDLTVSDGTIELAGEMPNADIIDEIPAPR